MMEGLVGCPRIPTSLPGPLDAGTTPSFLMPGSKVAGDGHFERVWWQVSSVPYPRHRAVVVMSLVLVAIHTLGRVRLWPHASASLGPCQTIHWLTGRSPSRHNAPRTRPGDAILAQFPTKLVT